jgi:hypothetical protein
MTEVSETAKGDERALTSRERAEARLARALRENLRKRRQQRTARAAAQSASAIVD